MFNSDSVIMFFIDGTSTSVISGSAVFKLFVLVVLSHSECPDHGKPCKRLQFNVYSIFIKF